eukprot:jgi/Ulvmu1/5876/UM251_0002.1
MSRAVGEVMHGTGIFPVLDRDGVSGVDMLLQATLGVWGGSAPWAHEVVEAQPVSKVAACAATRHVLACLRASADNHSRVSGSVHGSTAAFVTMAALAWLPEPGY